MADVQLIEDAAAVEPLRAEWDALAVEAGQPLAAPAWMLSWWRHVAPAAAELRVIAVRGRRGELIGLLPLYLVQEQGVRRLRVLADDFSSVAAPLAAPDRLWEVAEVAAELLASELALRPDALELGPLPSTAPWADALRERWPARVRPLAYRRDLLTAPVASLRQPDFDAWLATRRRSFRSNVRRRRRRFAQEGGTYRLATTETLAADVRTFATLHTARWAGIGSSRLADLGARLPLLLEELAAGLIAQERFRLFVLELDGQAVSTELVLAAGGEVVSVNAGWDERFSALHPATLSLVRVIEDGIERGERRLDLGWGRLDYKAPFADGAETVVWETLLAPGSGLARALPWALPDVADRRLRQSLKRALDDEQVEQIKQRLGGRLRRIR